MKSINEKGHFHAFVLILLVVAAVAGAGYFVWSRQADSDIALTPAPSQPCQGEWIDTHVHLDDMEFSHDVAEQMRVHDVGCSLMFTHVDLDDIEISMLEKQEEFYSNPGRFILFADVVRDDPKAVTRAKLDDLWSRYPGVFKGFGEHAFYRLPLVSTSLKSEPWPTIFQFAAEKDLFVMLHVTQKEKDDLVAMLSEYPDTKVLLHHRELIADLPELMKTHKNLYYTLDTTNLTTLTKVDGDRDNVLMFPMGEPNQDGLEEFIMALDTNKSKLLDSAVQDWTKLFETAPERIFWGTDVALEWHTNPEVYKRLMEFSDEFVARLPEQVRQGYKFGNALREFEEGVTMPQLSDEEFDRLDSSTDDEDE